MARRYYPGLIHRSEGGPYGIHFPDLPGCISAGDTAANCVANAEEAINLYIDELIADGQPIPPASSLEDVQAAVPDDHLDTFIAVQLVSAALPTKAVRLTISMDEDLVKRIDSAAGHYGRSGWLAEAAKDRLAAAGRK